ncbi:hypothetical protein HanRHA438_Chr09g0375301 [Helianthus annuus]|nr:hypothetical protein HanRHA438_Chr09g0375301 [Helianthus annuus]
METKTVLLAQDLKSLALWSPWGTKGLILDLNFLPFCLSALFDDSEVDPRSILFKILGGKRRWVWINVKI